MSQRLIVKRPGPWLSADGFRDLREVCHLAAVRLIELGVEQPQDNDINGMMITCRPNNRFNVLPPGRSDGHGWQATEQATVGCHQHQFCRSGLYHCLPALLMSDDGLTE